MPRLTPFLWFDSNAEEAVNHYLSVFPNSKIVGVTPYSDAGPGPKGSVMTVNFQLDGQDFVALNGGPHFKFTPAVSFVIHCKTQDEVDHYWARLLEGGQSQRCGWLTDKFGVSWQVVPTALLEMVDGKDPVRVGRMMKAMMQMDKLEIAPLKRAYAEG